MGVRVMLIDDSEADLLYTRIVLERSGTASEVLSFESAREALAVLEAGEPRVDLILLDINMPGMNGFEFLDAYSALPGGCGTNPDARHPPTIVMLTSSPDPDDRRKALSHLCVRGYVTKPIDTESARALLKHLAG